MKDDKNKNNESDNQVMSYESTMAVRCTEEACLVDSVSKKCNECRTLKYEYQSVMTYWDAGCLWTISHIKAEYVNLDENGKRVCNYLAVFDDCNDLAKYKIKDSHGNWIRGNFNVLFFVLKSFFKII